MFVRRSVYAASVAILFCTFIPKSFAQTSVYGTVALDAFGFSGSNFASGGSFKTDTGGFIAGAFYTFRNSSRLKAGIDGRIMLSPGYNGGSAYTGALRISFVPRKIALRPYFQIGGGVASTQLREPVCNGTCSMSTTRYTNGVAQLAFGLDIHACARLDVRALEYGADAGAAGSEPHTAAGFLDAGIVYHF